MVKMYTPWVINFELEQLREYLKTVREMLHDYEQKLEEAYTIEDLTEMDEEAEDRYYRYLDRFASVLGDFPRRIYSSFVTSWYSFVEDGLLQLCKDLDLEITIKVDEQLNLGSGIHKASKFLAEEKNYKIDNIYWQELNTISKIRNQLVHQGGRFTSFPEKPEDEKVLESLNVNDETMFIRIDKSIFNYLETHKIGSYYGTYFIHPTYEYCNYLVDFAEGFFSKMFQDLGLT